jgi:two-component system, NtrC family, nitrogen regulation response regulator GlnG
MDRLRQYSWPGNIRELQNVLRQALLRVRGRVLLAEFLSDLPVGPEQLGSHDCTDCHDRTSDLESFIQRANTDGTTTLLEDTQRWMEGILLSLVPEHTQGYRQQAARFLGIARQTLRSKLRDPGVTIHSSGDLGDSDDN